MSCCQDGCCNQGQEKQEVLVEVSVLHYRPDGITNTMGHFEDVPLGSVRVDGRTIQFDYHNKAHIFILADGIQIEIVEQ